MSRYREPCGCVHDGHEWLKMCEPCTIEFTERHVEAAIDHNEREAAKSVTPVTDNVAPRPVA
jgi:hypothetical protein